MAFIVIQFWKSALDEYGFVNVTKFTAVQSARFYFLNI